MAGAAAAMGVAVAIEARGDQSAPGAAQRPDHFLRQAQNNAWANATLFAALDGVSAESFAAWRPGFFPALSRTLNHVYEVDLFYIDALTRGGRGRVVFDRSDIADPAALGAAQAAADRMLTAFCADLTPAALGEFRDTDRANGPVAERVDWLLLHLFQHQIHHRGQAHVQLQHAGIAPPQLDDFYLAHGRVTSAMSYWNDNTGEFG
ncbi:MAG: DinB family protein [Pseudomonadota bacterium]